jgi:uncharacterized membrane protein YjgN (DUF898 family)
MDNTTTGEPQGGAPVSPTPVEFTGRRGYLFRLVLKNAVLTVLTLGIYRFWAKTRIRRYFWSNIRIGGEPLEYTGLPSELLIGFLIAIAFLLPITTVYSAITFYWRDNTEVLVVAQGIYTLVLLVLFNVAFYRMWRYRLTRTAWRGIRFNLEGSAWSYAAQAIAWLFTTAVSFGFAYPWMRVALAKAIWRNVRFGDGKFELVAKGRRLFVSWLTVLITSGIFIGVAVATSEGSFQDMADIEKDLPPQELLARSTPVFVFLSKLFLIGLIAIALFVWYRAREFRYFAGSLRFGIAGFSSDLSAPRIFGLLLISFGIGMVALTITMIVVMLPSVLLMQFALRTGAGVFSTGIMAFIAAALTFYVPLQIVAFVVFRYGLVAHICGTTAISDLAPFNLAAQASERGPLHGEGLADALDVGAF